MSTRCRINGFTAWVNLRLANPQNLLSDVLVDLMTGIHMKTLIESLTGSDFEKLQSYDGLTQPQKVYRAEWILAELKRWKIVPDSTEVDFKLFAARNSDQVFDLLWQLVSYDIWFVWDRMDYLQQAEESILCRYPFTWIPEPVPDLPKKKYKAISTLMGGFGSASVKYEEIPPDPDEVNPLDTYIPYPFADEVKSFKKRKTRVPGSHPKAVTCIMEMIQCHLRMTKDGRKLHVSSLDDVADVRVLCALVNSFLYNAFTPQVLINDRWSINILLRCIEEVFCISSTFEAQDLNEADLRGSSTYFCFFFMAGYKFRQWKAAADYFNQLHQLIRDCNTDLEKFPEYKQSMQQGIEKQKILDEIDRLKKELETLKEKYDIVACKEWVANTKEILEKYRKIIKRKMEDRFELISIPRTLSISDLCLALMINLSLTNGVGFYKMVSKEMVSEERKLVLVKKKTGEFLDDFTGKEKSVPIRKILRIPEEDTVELNPEDYPKFDIYTEAPTRSSTIEAGECLLYQVFPGSTAVWQRALLKAAKEGDLNTAQNLVNFFRNDSRFINCYDRLTGNRPLHNAAKAGHAKLVEFLLESGANFDARNAGRFTPLFSAIEGGHRDICHLLIEWGCNVHLKSIKGTNPIESCVNDALKATLEAHYAFYSANVPPLMDGDLPLLAKIVHDHRLEVRPLANLRSRLINGSTLLHTAAYYGELATIKELLKMRVDVNLQDYKGAAPLHRAKNVDTAKVLLDAGAEINSEDTDRNQPLHVKCYGEAGQPSQLDVVRLLLDSGASIAAANSRCLLPIHCAAMQGRIDIICLLREQDSRSLMAAALASESEDHPPSLIHLALANNSADCAKWLLDNGYAFKPNEPDHLLHRIVTAQLRITSKLAVVEFLLSHGNVDVNTRYPESGNSPLHYATALPDAAELIVLLIDFGADIDATNDDHSTPLFAACQANNPAAASLLVEFGANVRVKNNQGLTALDYVPDYQEWIKSGYFEEEMIARLRAYSLKHTRDLVRAISKKVKPAISTNQIFLETLKTSLNLALQPRPQTQPYFCTPCLSPLPPIQRYPTFHV